jgi:hypothetical protein
MHYDRRIHSLMARIVPLHVQSWRAKTDAVRALIKCELEANTRRIREAEYLRKYFLAYPDEARDLIPTLTDPVCR